MSSLTVFGRKTHLDTREKLTLTRTNAAADIAEARRQIQKKFGDESIVSVVSNEHAEVEAIKSGSILLDLALGVNGFPVGRMVELFGPESSGKSTIAFEAAKACQRDRKRPVLYLDFEHAFDPFYVGETIGVNLDDDHWILSQPDTMEQGLSIAEYMISHDMVGLVIVDSVAAMVTERERDGELEESPPMETAKKFAPILRKLVGTLSHSTACMIFVNHVREVVDSGPGGKRWGPKKRTTPGGRALKFYASVRVELTPIASVKGKVRDPITGKIEDGNVGVKIKGTVVKNKLAPPFRHAYFYMGQGKGIDERRTYIDVATSRGIMAQNGSRFVFPFENPNDPSKQVNLAGWQNALDWLDAHPDKEDQLRARVEQALQDGEPYLDRVEFVEGKRSALVSLTPGAID